MINTHTRHICTHYVGDTFFFFITAHLIFPLARLSVSQTLKKSTEWAQSIHSPPPLQDCFPSLSGPWPHKYCSEPYLYFNGQAHHVSAIYGWPSLSALRSLCIRRHMLQKVHGVESQLCGGQGGTRTSICTPVKGSRTHAEEGRGMLPTLPPIIVSHIVWFVYRIHNA